MSAPERAPRRTRGPQIDWERWFDGEWHTLVEGRDFHAASIGSTRLAGMQKAVRWNMRAQTGNVVEGKGGQFDFRIREGLPAWLRSAALKLQRFHAEGKTGGYAHLLHQVRARHRRGELSDDIPWEPTELEDVERTKAAERERTRRERAEQREAAQRVRLERRAAAKAEREAEREERARQEREAKRDEQDPVAARRRRVMADGVTDRGNAKEAVAARSPLKRRRRT